MHDDIRVPAGLLEALRADTTFPVRLSEVARARQRVETISLTDDAVLEAIATSLLDWSGAPARRGALASSRPS